MSSRNDDLSSRIARTFKSIINMKPDKSVDIENTLSRSKEQSEECGNSTSCQISPVESDLLTNIDVNKVLKIVTKPNLSEIKLSKQLPKTVLKTYSNRRKSFHKSSVVESFGLPDDPIIPLDKPVLLNEEDRLLNLPSSCFSDVNVTESHNIWDKPEFDHKVINCIEDIRIKDCHNSSIIDNYVAVNEGSNIIDLFCSDDRLILENTATLEEDSCSLQEHQTSHRTPKTGNTYRRSSNRLLHKVDNSKIGTGSKHCVSDITVMQNDKHTQVDQSKVQPKHTICQHGELSERNSSKNQKQSTGDSKPPNPMKKLVKCIEPDNLNGAQELLTKSSHSITQNLIPNSQILDGFDLIEEISDKIIHECDYSDVSASTQSTYSTNLQPCVHNLQKEVNTDSVRKFALNSSEKSVDFRYGRNINHDSRLRPNKTSKTSTLNSSPLTGETISNIMSTTVTKNSVAEESRFKTRSAIKRVHKDLKYPKNSSILDVDSETPQNVNQYDSEIKIVIPKLDKEIVDLKLRGMGVGLNCNKIYNETVKSKLASHTSPAALVSVTSITDQNDVSPGSKQKVKMLINGSNTRHTGNPTERIQAAVEGVIKRKKQHNELPACTTLQTNARTKDLTKKTLNNQNSLNTVHNEFVEHLEESCMNIKKPRHLSKSCIENENGKCSEQTLKQEKLKPESKKKMPTKHPATIVDDLINTKANLLDVTPSEKQMLYSEDQRNGADNKIVMPAQQRYIKKVPPADIVKQMIYQKDIHTMISPRRATLRSSSGHISDELPYQNSQKNKASVPTSRRTKTKKFATNNKKTANESKRHDNSYIKCHSGKLSQVQCLGTENVSTKTHCQKSLSKLNLLEENDPTKYVSGKADSSMSVIQQQELTPSVPHRTNKIKRQFPCDELEDTHTYLENTLIDKCPDKNISSIHMQEECVSSAKDNVDSKRVDNAHCKVADSSNFENINYISIIEKGSPNNIEPISDETNSVEFEHLNSSEAIKSPSNCTLNIKNIKLVTQKAVSSQNNFSFQRKKKPMKSKIDLFTDKILTEYDGLDDSLHLSGFNLESETTEEDNLSNDVTNKDLAYISTQPRRILRSNVSMKPAQNESIVDVLDTCKLLFSSTDVYTDNKATELNISDKKDSVSNITQLNTNKPSPKHRPRKKIIDISEKVLNIEIKNNESETCRLSPSANMSMNNDVIEVTHGGERISSSNFTQLNNNNIPRPRGRPRKNFVMNMADMSHDQNQNDESEIIKQQSASANLPTDKEITEFDIAEKTNSILNLTQLNDDASGLRGRARKNIDMDFTEKGFNVKNSNDTLEASTLHSHINDNRYNQTTVVSTFTQLNNLTPRRRGRPRKSTLMDVTEKESNVNKLNDEPQVSTLQFHSDDNTNNEATEVSNCETINSDSTFVQLNQLIPHPRGRPKKSIRMDVVEKVLIEKNLIDEPELSKLQFHSDDNTDNETTEVNTSEIINSDSTLTQLNNLTPRRRGRPRKTTLIDVTEKESNVKNLNDESEVSTQQFHIDTNTNNEATEVCTSETLYSGSTFTQLNQLIPQPRGRPRKSIHVDVVEKVSIQKNLNDDPELSNLQFHSDDNTDKETTEINTNETKNSDSTLTKLNHLIPWSRGRSRKSTVIDLAEEVAIVQNIVDESEVSKLQFHSYNNTNTEATEVNTNATINSVATFTQLNNVTPRPRGRPRKSVPIGMVEKASIFKNFNYESEVSKLQFHSDDNSNTETTEVNTSETINSDSTFAQLNQLTPQPRGRPRKSIPVDVVEKVSIQKNSNDEPELSKLQFHSDDNTNNEVTKVNTSETKNSDSTFAQLNILTPQQRGRPRKSTIMDVTEKESNVQNLNAESEVSKLQFHCDDNSGNEVTEVNTSETKKSVSTSAQLNILTPRPRGRPRKSTLMDMVENVSIVKNLNDESEVSKLQLHSDGNTNNESTEVNNSESKNSVSTYTQLNITIPQSRGRPRKNPFMDVMENVDKTESSDKETPVEIQHESENSEVIILHPKIQEITVQKNIPPVTQKSISSQNGENINIDSDANLPVILNSSDSCVQQQMGCENENGELVYFVGEIVWAKLGRHPYWPGLITASPETNSHKQTKMIRNKPTKFYHVTFFGDRGRRAWIKSSCLLTFNVDDDLVQITNRLKAEGKIPGGHKVMYKVNWKFGVEEAKHMMNKPVRERLEYFSPKSAMLRQSLKDGLSPRTMAMKGQDKTPRRSRSVTRKDFVQKRKRTQSLPSYHHSSEIKDIKNDIYELSPRRKRIKTKDCESESVELHKIDESSSNSHSIEVNIKKSNLRSSKLSNTNTKEINIDEELVNTNQYDTYDTKLSEVIKKDVSPRTRSDTTSKNESSLIEEGTTSYSTRNKNKIKPMILENCISDTESKVSENSSVPSTLAGQAVLYRRNNIFRGVSKEKVCQICQKVGSIVRCKGKCNGLFHIKCVENLFKKQLSAVKKSGSRNDENEVTNNIATVKESDKQKDTVPIESSIVTNKGPNSLIPTVEIVAVATKHTSEFPSNLHTMSPNFKKLSLAEKIDYKMKEIMMANDYYKSYSEIVDSSLEGTCLDSSIEGENSCANVLSRATDSPKSRNKKDKKYIIKHVTADDISFIQYNNEKVSISQESIDTCQFDEKKTTEFQDYKCEFCTTDIEPNCFHCRKVVSKKGSTIRQICSLHKCGRYYHPECLKMWPQTQWSIISTTKHRSSNKTLDTFVCPLHVCHTCASDDPRAASSRCPSDKLVKCLRCPASYHCATCCVPAGTTILSSNQIVCPRHYGEDMEGNIKKPMHVINTLWCFICSEGGDLICCETCPTSVHANCLPVNLTEDNTFICEDCESGRFPLYDEIAWVKLGHYRWWPAIILFPNEVPENVRKLKHSQGEFVVKFFGTLDHYWVSRGRVFLFQEGDQGHSHPIKRKIDTAFARAVEEAAGAHELKKEFKLSREAEKNNSLKPPPYIKIKINRPVGNVRQVDFNVSNTTPCDCAPNQPYPCGPDSDCLNRLLLTECNPQVCPAGKRCNNQCFEKKEYPPMVPYKTEGRGWGLKNLAPIRKGQFVIEYVGEIIDEQEYQRRIKKMHEQKEENYYFLTIDKDRMLDAGPKGKLKDIMLQLQQNYL